MSHSVEIVHTGYRDKAQREIARTVLSLGLAWHEDVASGSIMLACTTCVEQLEYERAENALQCPTCSWTPGLNLAYVGWLRFHQRLLFSLVEAVTNPLEPLVLTPPLYRALQAFRNAVFARKMTGVVLEDEEALALLQSLCKAHSGTV